MAAPRSKPGRALWEASMALARRAVVTPASTTFVIITLLFCVVLVIVHVFILFADAAVSEALSSAITAAQISPATYSYRDPGTEVETLLLCYQVPEFAGGSTVDNPCNISIPISTSGDTGFVQHFPEISWQRWAARRSSGLSFEPTFDDDGTVSAVTASSSLEDTTVSLSLTCVQSLIYTRERVLKESQEDIALIVFQVWLLTVSVFAIFYESVPHIWVSLCSRVLVTGWSVFAVVRAALNVGLYATLYRSTVSPCNLDIFDDYVSFRLGWVIAEVVCNWVFLVVLAILSVRLSKVYVHQTFRRLGPPPGVIKVYWNFMAVQVCIQLGVYTLAVAAGLFLDQLVNGPISVYTDRRALYLALCIGTLVFFIPYCLSGWYGIRRESKWLAAVFIACVCILIICWAIVFYSQVFRLTYLDFDFFAAITTLSFLILLFSLVFGIIALRWFGRGLATYLRAEDSLAKAGLLPDVFNILKSSKHEGSSTRSASMASEESLTPVFLQRPMEFADPIIASPHSPQLSGIPSALLHAEYFMREARDPFARDAQVVDMESVRRASMNVQRHSVTRARGDSNA
ncbi:unnamed protein product [Peniophora sp. CBMAI 1063]|nr:unnamed protein product [Peniophora sp. CBMAI 1063]